VQSNNTLKGAALVPNAKIRMDMEKPLMVLIRQMHDEVMKAFRMFFAEDSAMDEEEDLHRVNDRVDAIRKDFESRFSDAARDLSRRMMVRTLNNSTQTLGMSLRDISERFAISPDIFNGRLKEIALAQTTETANLIKALPQQYLGRVQTELMQAVTQGQGLKQIAPTMKALYGKSIRHARMVAGDQCAKAYTAINTQRCVDLGIQEFEWIHTSIPKVPRKDHVELNGKIFRFDDPPVIGVMYGKEVKGMPNKMPNCKCMFRPVISIRKMLEEEQKRQAA